MESPPNRQFILELVVRSSHPALLQGLDQWLQLGLLSDETVRHICREQLSCPIRLPASDATPTAEPTEAEDFLPELTPEPAAPARSPGPIAQILQSFMAEVSVVWLLFLGVFLVVVSSGVLAATQWQNFSPVGQYLILFAYTLAFCVAATLTGRQANLRLTSRMLQIATLLIIPVNFWMMDGFRLMESAGGLGIVAIAAFILSAITGWLLKTTASQQARLLLAAAITLSWLHFGWHFSGYPLIATYGGTILATLTLGRVGSGGAEEGGREEEWGNGGVGEEVSNADSQLSDPSPLSLSFLTIAFGTLLLLGRAVFVAQVPVNQLGLALGICGWLLGWLFRKRADRAVWTISGTGLLVLGWAVTVMLVPPWQAIGVSGLGLWLLVDYLRRTGEGQYLSASFLVGLQLIWLLWRVVPQTGRQWVVDTCIQLAGMEGMPLALLGLGFFPYLWLMLVLAFRWRRHRSVLANQAEWLALGLGVLLTAVSLGNPLVRSLNLALSSLTLVWVIGGRSQPLVPLSYLAHGLGLGAIGSGIQYAFPNLEARVWAMVLLLGVVMEWGMGVVGSLGEESQRRGGTELDQAASPLSPSPSLPLSPSPPLLIWQHSGWYYGLVLAGLSYVLLTEYQWQRSLWAGFWLLVPVLLTGLGSREGFFQWRVAAWLSILALFLVQPLVFDSTAGRLLGLGLATLLMLQNTRRLLHGLAAAVTVGFGVLFGLVVVWELSRQTLEFFWFLNLVAIVPLLLWLLRDYLRRRQTRIAELYQRASDGWAIGLTGFTLILISLTMLIVYLGITPARWQHASAAAILFIATGYRLWQSSIRGVLYFFAWSLELLVVGIIALTGKSIEAVGISHLALGLVAQLGGDWWAEGRGRRSTREAQRHGDLSAPSSLLPAPYLPSLHVIPLLYALLGLVLQHRSFTAATGLFTIAAALVGIGVGRRQANLKLLTYLSVLGISFGAYELVFYQLLQTQGGSPGDGFVLLALLAAGLMLVSSLLSPWLSAYLRLEFVEMQAIAHVHWALGSIFLGFAIFNGLSSRGEWWWIGTATLLSAYALAMGNERWLSPSPPLSLSPSPLTWTYIGIAQALLTLTYLLDRLLPGRFLTDWAGAIATIIAFLLCQAPWQGWGWQPIPFKRAAVILPVIVLLLTGGTVQSLLIAATFYAWLARADRQVRLSYISVALADWAILRLFNQYGLTEPLWFAIVLGLSLLYVAQIDPVLQSPSDRDRRHWLRCLATGLICLTAIYQSEVGIPGMLLIVVGGFSVGFALAFVAVGIWLKVRAFLYVGTIAFMLQVLRLLWRFIQDYSLLLWAMGIALGLLMIWIAATFEARRVQITSLISYWAVELNRWD